ncbi:scamp family-domain-containing protein [Mrakia frigida]|uniref:secretory carrier-associated membrane protein n=1 Tax=Mrakia frigida TaxID=29902 RepID=UPI003FCC1F7B
MATPYSSNSNPFADPSNENPFESSASIPSKYTQPSITDREAALNAREVELARREREVADAGVLMNNWPKFYPLIHHDISTAIPHESQATVTRLFQIWLALVATLLFNLLGCIFLLIAGASNGGSDMIASIVYVPFITLGSFFLWYRPIYWAYAKEYAIFYYIYFVFGGIHVAFSIYMAIGIPSTGSAGLINTIEMFAQSHILAAVFGVISSVGWVFQALFSLAWYKLIWAHHNSKGHTMEKAKGEVAQQGFWMYLTKMSKV